MNIGHWESFCSLFLAKANLKILHDFHHYHFAEIKKNLRNIFVHFEVEAVSEKMYILHTCEKLWMTLVQNTNM